MSPAGRLATVVVVDRAGRVRGATAPTRVAMPWLQEVGPVTTVVPGSTALRLLEAGPEPHTGAGRTAT
ncbi:MAG: hypothetical protein GY925_18275 [Actinomycetia bacterium]|nr:hypothetical protein [Actinomycetes bacterium]